MVTLRSEAKYTKPPKYSVAEGVETIMGLRSLAGVSKDINPEQEWLAMSESEQEGQIRAFRSMQAIFGG